MSMYVQPGIGMVPYGIVQYSTNSLVRLGISILTPPRAVRFQQAGRQP